MAHRFRSELKRSNYRLLGLIGQGQFGRVYCAVHRQTGQLVALKSLDHDRFPTHQFLRELRFLVTLQHPNIVACRAIEHLHGRRYLVMDYCEAGTLRDLMENHDRLPPALSIKLVCDILAGLEHAHAQDIVHCDIKPENILLSLDAIGWTARISDFGIARLCQDLKLEAANLTGSPAYMAPERFYGQYSPSTDLYAIGILLFELLLGYRPFSGAPTELMAAHLNQPVKIPAQIPTPLQTVILTALQKLKARRYQTATQMLEALQLAVQQRPELRFQNQSPIFVTAADAMPILKEEPLQHRVEQIAAIEPSLLPQYDRDLRRSTLIFLSERTTIRSRLAADLLQPSEALQVATITEPIQQLVMRSQACFALTERSLYRLSENPPQLLTRFHQPSRITISPNNRWMAVGALGDDRALKILSIWALPQPQLMRRPSIFESGRGRLIELVAISANHIAAFSHRGDRTQLDLFNRRGHAIATLTFAAKLDRIVQSPKGLVATEIGHDRSLLLIHFKPYKLTRIAIEIDPKFIAALPWGIALADSERLILLDAQGRTLSRVDVGSGICAIAAYGDNLAIATWQQTQGKLYTIDLRAIQRDFAANL